MILHQLLYLFFFFFNDTATTEIYTLSLHDALPICAPQNRECRQKPSPGEQKLDEEKRKQKPMEVLAPPSQKICPQRNFSKRSEEHTSELQSQSNLVCRLLLEKKKRNHLSITDCRSN